MSDDEPIVNGEKSKDTRFKPGNPGGGRPKGARNKLGEDFIKAMADDFSANGVEAIEKVRTDRPHEYLKVIASLLPKELNVKVSDLDELTDEQLDRRIATLLAAFQSGIGKAAGGEGEAHAAQSPSDVPAVH